MPDHLVEYDLPTNVLKTASRANLDATFKFELGTFAHTPGVSQPGTAVDPASLSYATLQIFGNRSIPLYPARIGTRPQVSSPRSQV